MSEGGGVQEGLARLARAASWFSAVSGVLFALGLALTLSFAGGPLAAAAALYGGTGEPAIPHEPFPWVGTTWPIPLAAALTPRWPRWALVPVALSVVLQVRWFLALCAVARAG